MFLKTRGPVCKNNNLYSVALKNLTNYNDRVLRENSLDTNEAMSSNKMDKCWILCIFKEYGCFDLLSHKYNTLRITPRHIKCTLKGI